ncbi:MAG: STAS/SEC14 domain-containing protein [Desulfomonilaceae bacterium]|nr:STAS/SEC14 domain-containing protein [Desulfomonilaceae bacterium]
MIEILPESADNVLAVKGSGKLTGRDYDELLIPSLESVMKEHGRARFLFYMAPDFKGWDLNATREYASFGLRHRDRFEKVAAVCGPKWVHWGMKLTSYLTDGEVKTFSCDRAAEAREWIAS